MSNKRLRNDPLDWINKSPEQVEEKRKQGRPRTIKREYTKSSQEGLKDNWTRYTVIVREDLLKRLKQHVKDENVTMKVAINDMIENYLNEEEAAKHERD